MSIIKSFSVGNGDMFYIKHAGDNFTIIDCCLCDENKEKIVEEIQRVKKGKSVTRFISTHPDGDHIQNLDYLDDKINILNFYCVQNEATKEDITSSFRRYCELRNCKKKSFYIFKGCSRKWMNQTGKDNDGDERGSSSINILWPDTSNSEYKEELKKAKEGTSFNNLSCIIKYSLENGVTAIWLGDLQEEFMEKIKDEVNLPKTNILFAPHHGKKSGKIPDEWINKMDPDIIIMGEANSNDSDYASYPDHNKIRQNSAGDIIFECDGKDVHIYVSSKDYEVDFLTDKNKSSFEYYIGTLTIKKS